MVKTGLIALGVVLALAGRAGARPVDIGEDTYVSDDVATREPDDDSPAFNMLGLDMAIGGLPQDGARTLVGSIGLGIEHPVFKKTRVALEYDWLFVSERDDSMRGRDANAIRPEHHGSGHRVGLALRRELKATGGRSTRLFLDGEAGATVALINDNMVGERVVPGGYLGLRAGYDLYTRHDSSPSRTFETAVLFRMIGVQDGVGFSVGLGMFWGN